MSRLRTEGLIIRRNHIAQLASAIEARTGAVSHLPYNSSNGRVHETNVDAQENFYENVDTLQDIPYVNVNARADWPHGSVATNPGSTLNHTALDEQEGRQEMQPTPEEAEAGELGGNISTPSLDQDKFQTPQKEWDETFIKVVKSVAIIILFLAVLASATISKVTFVAIAAKMYDAVANTDYILNGESSRRQWSITFTQIVVVLMSPQLITIVRTFFTGTIGKNRRIYPWPSIGAIVMGVIVSILEATALTAFAFLVATHLHPAKSILLTSGIFLFTAFLGMCCCCCNGKQPLQQRERTSQCTRYCDRFMNSSFMNFIAFILQLGGIAGGVFLLVYTNEQQFERWLQIDLGRRWSYIIRVALTVLVAGPLLSVLWSRVVQRLIFYKKQTFQNSDARNRASLELPGSRCGGCLYAFVRVIVIPIVAYGFMRVLQLEPDFTLAFKWTGLDIAVVLVQILSSLLTFVLCLISLWTTAQSWAFTLPLLLSTPAAVGWYWLCQIPGASGFPFYQSTPYFFEYTKNFNGYILPILGLIWVGQVLALGGHIWKKPKYALAREQSLFLSPYYDPIFLDSFLLLNRHSTQVCHFSTSRGSSGKKKRPAVFICSTVYREAEHEMKDMLMSINRVVKATGKARESVSDPTKFPHYESHIFFDDATIGQKFNEFVLQLISLLEETLGVTLDNLEKMQTPYGYQLRWIINDTFPLYIHLKDNSKVKNRKRWSEVMYMSYILNYRLQERDEQGKEMFDPHSTYILTTDADVEFKANSVAALLYFLARDDSVGAVCARTHPTGSGPLVWYQIFEYAFGHWFQKSAEHVLGNVLCCPGCFSVFRASAIADVLETYQSSVTSASEFLTKDMGEDRWLCSLLIQKGWRLEYAGFAKATTYCPDSFDEFYNQRRRWIPSTLANLLLMMRNAKSIAFNSTSVSFLFILYQLIMIFSTIVTPSTVIILMGSGLQSAYNWDPLWTITIFTTISILYGLVCLIFPENVQLALAKALTAIFAVVMVLALAGLFIQTVKFLELQGGEDNATIATNVEAIITVDSVFLWACTFIVLTAAVLHLKEALVLVHFAWYILGLPAAYLLLMIYSATNLNNRSWGTRVGISAKKPYEGEEDKFKSFGSTLIHTIERILNYEWGDKDRTEDAEQVVFRRNPGIVKRQGARVPLPIRHQPIQEDVKQWLKRLQCEEFIPNFEEHGYTRFEFIWGTTTEDLKAIGIKQRGFLIRLEKAIKKGMAPLFQSKLPDSIAQFLEGVYLEEYLPLFNDEGYCTHEDIEHMIGMTRDDLRSMGITKRAHVNTLMAALTRLRNPTGREIRIHNTKAVVEKAPTFQMAREDPALERFWSMLTQGVLKPEVVHANSDDLKEKLDNLRNTTIIAMLMINVMWMALLLSINVAFSEQFGIRQSALPVLFVVLYFCIILIQFICLVAHRIETLIHIIANTNL